MGKQTETLTALQKLVTALKSQITLTKEEGDLKVKEETQKRIESAKSFEVREREKGQYFKSLRHPNNCMQ